MDNDQLEHYKKMLKKIQLELKTVENIKQVTIPQNEFRTLVRHIKDGLNNPKNPAAISLAKISLITLSDGYDIETPACDEGKDNGS